MSRIEVVDNPVAKFLFSDTRMAIVWLVLRVWLGLQWLQSGWGKVTNPAWVETGAALQGFWTKAIVVPETGKPVVVYDWYRGFLEALLSGGHYTWFADLVAYGEVAIGLGLILGAFVGVAAFFGVFMNWHFVMAGAASTNAMSMFVGLLLILAWKTAGWIGVDRILLSKLGTPWAPVRVVSPHQNE